MSRARERLDIERLVNWAIEDQGLRQAYGDAGSTAGWAELGTRVDGGTHDYSGRGLIGGAAHHDAVILFEAISGLPPEAAALVLRQGRVGYGLFARPDWCAEGVGGLVQDRTPSGKLCWEYADKAKGRGPRTPRLIWVGQRPEIVEFCRAQYGLWWEGLRDLVGVVNLAMLEHEASGPAAHPTPWDAPPPVVHLDAAPAKPVGPPASVPTPRIRRRKAVKAA